MEGVHFIVDERGAKRAVILDLDRYGALWDDFYDNLVAESRRHDRRLDWETLKKKRVRKPARR